MIDYLNVIILFRKGVLSIQPVGDVLILVKRINDPNIFIFTNIISQ